MSLTWLGLTSSHNFDDMNEKNAISIKKKKLAKEKGKKNSSPSELDC